MEKQASVTVRIKSAPSKTYPIFIGAGLLAHRDIWASVPEIAKASRVLIVYDNMMPGVRSNAGIVGLVERAQAHLEEYVNLKGKVHFHGCFSDGVYGEGVKTLKTVEHIWDACIHYGLDRNSILIALGGGIVGDLVGFAAAAYKRGVRFVQVPTTLLAMVDSSVGGKTGVNFKDGKNDIGFFYQPIAVIADLDLLRTLPSEEFSAGLAEVVKYGAIADVRFFKYLEKKFRKILDKNSKELGYIVKRSCQIKAKVVGQDEKDTSGVRELLNFGHTVGHAIEGAAVKDRKVLHGKAVALGMLMAAKLSLVKGFLNKKDVDSLEKLLCNFQLPVNQVHRSDKKNNLSEYGIQTAFSFDELLPYLKRDKKIMNGVMTFVLLKKIGEAFSSKDVSLDEVRTVWDSLGA